MKLLRLDRLIEIFFRFTPKLLTNCELRTKRCAPATHVEFFLFCRIWRNL
jgi:hypothetical protein